MRRQRLRADQWRITWQDHNDLGIPNRSPGDLHGVPGTMLRLLQHGLRAGRFHDCHNLLSLMPHHDDCFLRAQRSARPQNLLDQGAATRPVEHLCQAGL